jgi:hypothetical protein
LDPPHPQQSAPFSSFPSSSSPLQETEKKRAPATISQESKKMNIYTRKLCKFNALQDFLAIFFTW